MNRPRRQKKPRRHHLPAPPYKLPRLAKRTSPHVFLAFLILIPIFLVFRQLPQHTLYTPLENSVPPNNAHQQHPPPQHHLEPERREVAPLGTRSTTLSSQKIADVSIDALLICHYTNPCCITAVSAGLLSLIRQTVIPTSLTLLHSCSLPSESGLLNAAAKDILTGIDNTPASLSLYNALADQFCSADSQRLYDECILRYVRQDAREGRYRLLLSDRDVLEPTAVEKLWMYLEFHPNVRSVQSLSFEEASLRTAIEKRDTMAVRAIVPQWNHSTVREISAVPIMYNDDFLARMQATKADSAIGSAWQPLVNLLSNGRLIREALYTTVRSRAEMRDLTYRQSILSLQHALLDKREIPPRLHSDLAFYKWSSRTEEREMYQETFSDVRHLDIESLAVGQVEKLGVKRAMFLMPWIDMGGSEKAMLDLADRMLSLNWALTFVLTMPNWQEDPLGEIMYANAWLHKALSLTSDVVNLVALAPNHLESKAFRYVLETRRPDVVFNSNTRWAYGHSKLIRAIVPDAIIGDYNHMIHPQWLGGGLPRYGANNSRYFDVHFTASKDVAGSMEKWINPSIMERNPDKVKPCYIGTDPDIFYIGSERQIARASQRRKLGISEDANVILFAGRFVTGKGTDVIDDLIKKSNADVNLVGKFYFVLVGDGPERRNLESLKRKYENVLVHPPAPNLLEMRNYYAMSDVLLLPSVNEGIALVLYEAMASELLVLTTDVGGQSELVTPESGILIRDSRLMSQMSDSIIDSLRGILANPDKYDKMRVNARNRVRSRFTTAKFCDCVLDGLKPARKKDHETDLETGHETLDSEYTSGTNDTFNKLSRDLVREAITERGDGLWKRGFVPRSLDYAVTIGIKTYVCDDQTIDQVHSLIRSIRVNYGRIRILLGNDGPTSLANEDFVKQDTHTEEVLLPRNSGISIGRNTLVNMTTTKFFMLLDDDHMFDDSTNLVNVVTSLEKDYFDIIGLRIRNLPGIDELERTGISIPRYVARILSLKDRRLTLCIWNENDGPSVHGMGQAIRVNVLHNAFIGRTDVLRAHGWRDELQVNEHMTFFLDAWRAGVNVGYLPSEFVHHRARLYSKCYYDIRFREDRFRKLLDYEDRFFYDIRCGRKFPDVVREHLGQGIPLDDED